MQAMPMKYFSLIGSVDLHDEILSISSFIYPNIFIYNISRTTIFKDEIQ